MEYSLSYHINNRPTRQAPRYYDIKQNVIINSDSDSYKKDTSMKMKRKKFRIGELAQQLSVERFVIRFWEKEFELTSTRSDGGQRFYTEDDLDTFSRIKELLYNLGFTIQGAKKQIAIDKASGAQRTTLENTENKGAHKTEWNDDLVEQIGDLKKKLKKLREML